MTSDANALLQRLQTTAAVCCAGMALVALIVAGGQPRPAVGVIGGGLLAGVSLLGIRSSVVGLLMPGATGATRPRVAWALVKAVGRYALLALLAYVMIARLRLHPWGLLAGASSVVAGVSVEAVRFVLKK